MRRIFVRNAVKLFFFHRVHRISYIKLPQNSMQQIFVRNAVNFSVNFCKKCGEISFFTAFTESPHSPHFLQNFTQKPRPGSHYSPTLTPFDTNFILVNPFTILPLASKWDKFRKDIRPETGNGELVVGQAVKMN